MGQMRQLDNSFRFQILDGVEKIFAPQVSATRIFDADGNPKEVVVRVMVITSTEISESPDCTIGENGEGQITYIAGVYPEPAPGNTYIVWYSEEMLAPDVEGVHITVENKGTQPPTTSRGTQTSVQSGTGNTIDE